MHITTHYLALNKVCQVTYFHEVLILIVNHESLANVSSCYQLYTYLHSCKNILQYSEQINTYMFITGVPAMVPGVTVDENTININGNSVTLTLSWEQPFSNFYPIQYYIVSCSHDPTCPPRLITTRRSYTITNLIPMTTYIFSIVAINAVGSGEAGVVTITTPKGEIIITTTTTISSVGVSMTTSTTSTSTVGVTTSTSSVGMTTTTTSSVDMTTTTTSSVGMTTTTSSVGMTTSPSSVDMTTTTTSSVGMTTTTSSVGMTTSPSSVGMTTTTTTTTSSVGMTTTTTTSSAGTYDHFCIKCGNDDFRT